MSKILKQGNLDGFCLLYSYMNAFKSLKYPNKTAHWFVSNQSHVWKKMVSVTPSLHNFASGEGSVFEISTNYTDINVKEGLGYLYAEVIGEKKEGYRAYRIDFEVIESAIERNSVVIVCLNGPVETYRGKIGDHWVCFVDADLENYYLACSYIDHIDNKNKGSIGGVSPFWGRPFNNTLKKEALKRSGLIDNSIYCFCHEE